MVGDVKKVEVGPVAAALAVPKPTIILPPRSTLLSADGKKDAEDMFSAHDFDLNIDLDVGPMGTGELTSKYFVFVRKENRFAEGFFFRFFDGMLKASFFVNFVELFASAAVVQPTPKATPTSTHPVRRSLNLDEYKKRRGIL